MGVSSGSDSEHIKDSSDQASSVLKGRVQKKRGLSRHYPHKAQSFDCIASLGRAASHNSSALVLSKSLSRRGDARRCPGSPGAASSDASALRRVTSSGTIHECPTEESCWSSIETELCCALQTQACLQPPPQPPPQLGQPAMMCREHSRNSGDSSNGLQLAA
jgi:hypothetical protein